MVVAKRPERGQIYLPSPYSTYSPIFGAMVVKRANATMSTGGDDRPRTEDGEVIPTVHQLTSSIANVLDGSFSDVAVQGEVSQWTVAGSGHTYFTLKDDKAVLSAVLWRGKRQPHRIETGMQVVARGRIAVYAPRGQYQLDCVSVAPIGLGDLQLQFEALKRRLQAEGLFDQAHKRPLPPFPKRIGVVTSKSGAAIRDIVTTLARRMPSVEVVFRPAVVQGTTAAPDVVQAIAELNELPDIDVMIVGRGGGSLEDLWAFNEEIVARAIYNSRIPVVSAVGHEIDTTIADFVADMRAATPTAAAELVVRDRAELLPVIQTQVDRLSRLLSQKVATGRGRLEGLMSSRGLSRPVDIVRALGQRVDELEHRAAVATKGVSERSRARLDILDASLRALNPRNVLARGYAIVERGTSPITRASDLDADDRVVLNFHDGKRPAVITSGADGDDQDSLSA